MYRHCSCLNVAWNNSSRVVDTVYRKQLKTNGNYEAVNEYSCVD